MKSRWLLLFAFTVGTTGSSFSQEPPSSPVNPHPQDPPSDALLYERDFDLLLEEAGVPTLGQLELERQIAAIAPDRAAAEKRAASLRKRLKALENNYTLEELAEELAIQGVSDIRTAQANLMTQIHEVGLQVETLVRRERELVERRNR